MTSLINPVSTLETFGHHDDDAGLRVFAIQYRIDLGHTRSYDTFRDAMRQIMEQFVVPHKRLDLPTLVVFPELIGLPTIAIGPRGQGFRDLHNRVATPTGTGVPPGLEAGMADLARGYEQQMGAYAQRFDEQDLTRLLFLASTDTSVRAFNTTFSDIARDYGVYVVAGHNQAQFSETDDPELVGVFADPQSDADTAFVASDSAITNNTYLWGPNDVRHEGPVCQRNLMFTNRKIPLTPIEQALGVAPGPATGHEAEANAGYVEVEGFKIGFATSLPAFQYGYPFGQLPQNFDPLADYASTYAAAQNQLGVDVMIQADANPGPWAAPVASGAWQPLEWMGSTWRAVADPTVGFRYNVTPMMTGNLLDVVFDGQSAITARGHDGVGQAYVGNSAVGPNDPGEYEVYAGMKGEFLALAPWASDEAGREELMATMMGLLPGSGTPFENHYIQTALFADLRQKPHGEHA